VCVCVCVCMCVCVPLLILLPSITAAVSPSVVRFEKVLGEGEAKVRDSIERMARRVSEPDDLDEPQLIPDQRSSALPQEHTHTPPHTHTTTAGRQHQQQCTQKDAVNPSASSSSTSTYASASASASEVDSVVSAAPAPCTTPTSDAECVDSGEFQPFWARALFACVPDQEDDLAFEEEDLVLVIDLVDENWWQGECHDTVGIFPSTYVERIPVHEGETKKEALDSWLVCVFL
jgi:SH3 domain